MSLKSVCLGALLIGWLALAPQVQAQRGGRGGGGMSRGGMGGGMPMGGGGGGMSRGGMGAMGPHGGPGAGGMPGGGAMPGGGMSRSMAGPGGGQVQAGARSGTYDTQRGGTINYGAAGVGGTGPGGGAAGRGVYGVSGTTAGGRTYGDVGRVGGVQGPGGYGAVGRTNVGGVAGPNGAMVGGSRGAAAYGPGGAVAAGERGRVGASGAGTYYASSAGMAAVGADTRAAYRGANYFTPNWYARYPAAWAPRAYVAAPVPGWGALASFCGYPAQPAYYDYGGNVVAQPDAMYVNGDPAGTPQQYADQATQLASGGNAAQADPNDAWQPIGIFAVAPNGDNPPNEFFQLAINKKGVLRGNYHNADGDQTIPLGGAVDPKGQRAAWTIGQSKAPVFEAGIANLTKDETMVLIHAAGGDTSQVLLVRMPPPDTGQGPGQGQGGNAPR